MVSNFFQQTGTVQPESWPVLPGSVYPQDLTEMLSEFRVHPSELTAAHILPFVPLAAEVDQERDPRLSNLAHVLAHAATVQATATWIMEHQEWDFLAVYFDAIDHWSHGFMQYRPPRLAHVSEEQSRLYGSVVDAGYRFHDMMLARLLELAGEDTTVILLSDHGFQSDHLRLTKIPREPAGPAMEHRPMGILCLNGPHIRQDERVYGASLLDITPTILTLLGLPIGRDMQGKVIVTAFDTDVMPEIVETWESSGDTDGGSSANQPIDPWAEKAAMDQLVALGYVDPPDENIAIAVEKAWRESQFYLARVYVERGMLEDARSILESLHLEDPDAVRYSLWLINILYQIGRHEEGRAVAETLLDREDAPRSSIERLQGSLLVAEGNVTDGLLHLKNAETLDPDHPVLQQQLGRAYLEAGQLADPERALLRAATLDPDYAIVHDGLAQVYLRTGRLDDALESGLRAVGLRYYLPRAHFKIGVTLMKLGEYEQAVSVFEVCLKQAPNMQLAHFWLSEIYRNHLNNFEKAAFHTRMAADASE